MDVSGAREAVSLAKLGVRGALNWLWQSSLASPRNAALGAGEAAMLGEVPDAMHGTAEGVIGAAAGFIPLAGTVMSQFDIRNHCK
jgi:hypothetical protein